MKAMNTHALGRSAVLGALLGATVASGCGPSNGSSTPASCLQVQPCGGDVVGTWTFLGACTNAAFLQVLNGQLQTDCPGASISAVDVNISGTILYKADATYAANVTEAITGTETIPLSCLGFASCAEVKSIDPESTLTCTGTTICTCHVAASPPMNETGTYTTSGTDVTTVSSTSTSPSTDSYCVENNQLHIISADHTTGALLGDFVAQKQ